MPEETSVLGWESGNMAFSFALNWLCDASLHSLGLGFPQPQIGNGNSFRLYGLQNAMSG